MAPLRLGPSCPPSVLGVKHSLLPPFPSPPPSSPPLPSSPPPHLGTSNAWLLQDWQDWIAERCWLAGHALSSRGRICVDDLAGFKGLLLVQVENAGPSSISTLALALATPVVLGPYGLSLLPFPYIRIFAGPTSLMPPACWSAFMPRAV